MLERFSTITYRWADGGRACHLIAFARKVLALGVELVQRTDDLTWLTPQSRSVRQNPGWRQIAEST